MTIALIDNGSLEPAAHRQLRAIASAIGSATGAEVEAVSWKHSDRIDPGFLDGTPAWTLAPWIRSKRAQGEDEFLFVPFFISAQGAIGSALRTDLEALKVEVGSFHVTFTESLASGPGAKALVSIVADRVRDRIAASSLLKPAVIVVDHGGPSPASASLRDQVTDGVRKALGFSVVAVAAASMESPEGSQYAFNHPLLADLLGQERFNRGDVVIAPLFLAPGRHAGPDGDLAQIAHRALAIHPGLHCHFSGLVGGHPLALETLARNLGDRLTAAAMT